jgi:cytoskeleton protein RodZ
MGIEQGGPRTVPFRGTGRAGENMGWGKGQLTGFGELLQQARAYKGVSLREAERTTRIPRRHLSALENEEFHQLPPLIYARGIVRNYAQYLGLDPVATLARFEQVHGQRSGGFRVVPAVKTVDVPSHWAPNFAIIAFMVVMSAVIFAWMYSAYFAPPDPTSPTEQAVVTPTADQEVASLDEEPTPGLAEGGGESMQTSTPVGAEDPEESSNEDESPEVTATEESDDEALPVDPTPEPPLEHTFAITTVQPVWIQATMDGEMVFEDIVQPGQTLTLEGKQLSLVSGNAPLVNVTVDGEDQGPLGDHWDATNTYP